MRRIRIEKRKSNTRNAGGGELPLDPRDADVVRAKAAAAAERRRRRAA